MLMKLTPGFRLCSAQGSDLLQPSSLTEETYVLNALASKPAYSQPVMPGTNVIKLFATLIY
jgi:hypothetical protein